MFCAFSPSSGNIAQTTISHRLSGFRTILDEIGKSMAKQREGQSHPLYITGSSGIPSQPAQQIIRDSVHQPRAGSPAAGKASPQRMQPHPHLLEEHIWLLMLSSPSEAYPRRVLGLLAGCERSGEISPRAALKELSSPLAPGYSPHLFKSPFCSLGTTTEEVSAAAITYLQQKSGENYSSELVRAVRRPILCP